jgi:hypothetical protein
MPKQVQIERLEKINKLIKYIGDKDHELCKSNYGSFFKAVESQKGTKNNYSRFEFTNNRIYFIDKYTEAKIYPYASSKHQGFSGGGTIWGLVNDFREWIITGKYSDGNNGYAGLYCPHWGGRWTLEEKDILIEKAKEIDYIEKERGTFTDYCKRNVQNGNGWTVSDYQKKIKELLEQNK